MDPKTEARIRDRAYHLWMEAGGQHGRADDYWYRAEQEILSEQAMADTTASAREEGPDRSAELLSGTPDGATAGEAGVGHPQKPGEPLDKPAARKPAARKSAPAAAKPAAPKSSGATAPAPKTAATKAGAPKAPPTGRKPSSSAPK